MKKAEAISILATSVRPREAKDRARYDEAVKMAIEALKSSERTAETTQTDHIADIGKKVERAAETAQDVQSVDDALTLLDSIHSGGRMMYSDYCALHDAISSISVQTVIDDTVSRKAAIDALKEAFNPSITNFVKAKIAIDKLSSAQPEVLACGEGELFAEPEQRWIPVTERLPENDNEVLIAVWDAEDDYVEVYKGFYQGHEWWTQWCHGCSKIKDEPCGENIVIAWMPLPEPYQEGGE